MNKELIDKLDELEILSQGKGTLWEAYKNAGMSTETVSLFEIDVKIQQIKNTIIALIEDMRR